MSEEEIQAIRERVAKASSGPWYETSVSLLAALDEANAKCESLNTLLDKREHQDVVLRNSWAEDAAENVNLKAEIDRLKRELADCKSFTVASALEAALRQEIEARAHAVVEMRGHLEFMRACDCEIVSRGAKYHDPLCCVTLADKALAVNWRDFLDKEKAG